MSVNGEKTVAADKPRPPRHRPTRCYSINTKHLAGDVTVYPRYRCVGGHKQAALLPKAVEEATKVDEALTPRPVFVGSVDCKVNDDLTAATRRNMAEATIAAPTHPNHKDRLPSLPGVTPPQETPRHTTYPTRRPIPRCLLGCERGGSFPQRIPWVQRISDTVGDGAVLRLA